MKKLIFALVIAMGAIASASAQTKIAHVNSQKLLDTMPSRKAAIKEINQLEAAGIKELRDMDSAVQATYQVYMAKKATYSPTVDQFEQQKIQRMQQNLEQRQQEIDQQLQILSGELNKKTLDLVKKAVNNISVAKKLNYVIDESTTLFSAGGMDITNEVIVELLKLDAEANKK
ncbi:MAG: OmpH family outer membrane protein [Fluviicola sp.]|nr:OmpH family outer membrane protein [Fluviicola sp.]MBP6272679.1 OmpH family outer membrane protein [Fluviicola sp.]